VSMGRYDAVLFDFDGVLLDSEPVHFACWAEILQPIGVEIDWPYYRKYCIGLHDDLVISFLAARADPPLVPQDIWRLYPRKRQSFLRKLQPAPPFPQDLVSLLGGLRAYGLAVVSSSDRSEIEPLLEAGGIRSYFQALVCAGDVEEKKPAPEPYLAAARLLGANAPLVVEDSDNGVASGLAAGFDVLRVSAASETAAAVAGRLKWAG
jgi:HAD superfamily hydrolase (TIGR01509 family)